MYTAFQEIIWKQSWSHSDDITASVYVQGSVLKKERKKSTEKGQIVQNCMAIKDKKMSLSKRKLTIISVLKIQKVVYVCVLPTEV